MPVNFHIVTGELYRGGEPSVEDLQILHDAFGIRKIVSLDKTIADKIHNDIMRLGMQHVVIPLCSTGRELQLLDGIKHNIKELLTECPTYVHCRHGSDRTGIVCGLYRIAVDGWTPEAALDEMIKYGFGEKIRSNRKSQYTDYIVNCKNKQDSNDAPSELADDATIGVIRDQHNIGNEEDRRTPLFGTNQSFNMQNQVESPELMGAIPFKNTYTDPPKSKTDSGYQELYQSLRKQIFQDILQTLNGDLTREDMDRITKQKIMDKNTPDSIANVPMVGQNDSYPGIRGVGPTESVGFMGHQ